MKEHLKPFADTPNGIEHWKSILDLLKHITTVSSAIVVVCITMYEKINISELQFFLIASIALFITTSVCSIVSHTIYVASFRRGLYNIKERSTLGWALVGTVISMCAAFICLATYVLFALIVS